jgi:sugar phosphate permease
MCETKDSAFMSTKINMLGITCSSVSLYMTVLILYMTILAGKHKLTTNTKQIHREALSVPAGTRNIGKIAGYALANTLIHIIYVIFVTSNNFGFLVAAVVAHVVGVVLVFRSQRPDHKHPIRSLAHAIQNLSQADSKTKKEWQLIKQAILAEKTLKM